MSAAARKAATRRKNRTASSNTAGAERRKPTRNSDTDEAVVAQRLALVQDVEALYRPLREAVEAELAKTESGRQALEATRAFGEELGELSQSIYAGKTPYEVGLRIGWRSAESKRCGDAMKRNSAERTLSTLYACSPPWTRLRRFFARSLRGKRFGSRRPAFFERCCCSQSQTLLTSQARAKGWATQCHHSQ